MNPVAQNLQAGTGTTVLNSAFPFLGSLKLYRSNLQSAATMATKEEKERLARELQEEARPVFEAIGVEGAALE